MEEKLVKMLNEMSEYLDVSQMKKLQEVLVENLQRPEKRDAVIDNAEYLDMFIAAKKIEGCSARTVAILVKRTSLKWWDYWKEYWQKRGTDQAYEQDYACEVTIPYRK